MTSQQKSSKKSNKFSYLSEQNQQQKLLGQYQTSKISPTKYIKNYHQTSLQNNKENINRKKIQISENRAIKNQSFQSKDYSNQSMNQRIISFSKLQASNQPQDFINQNKFEEKQIKQKVLKNSQKWNLRQQNRKLLENKRISDKVKTKSDNYLQFSPYKQQIGNLTCINQHKFCREKQNITSVNMAKIQDRIQIEGFNSFEKNKLEQKYIIYELEEQHKIIKNQLRQCQFQNGLLRQKINYLQGENKKLKNQNFIREKQLKDQLQYKQFTYIRQIEQQKQLIFELQSINQTRQQERETLFIERQHYDELSSKIQEELKFTVKSKQLLQITLHQKDQQIISLKTKLQLAQINIMKEKQMLQNNNHQFHSNDNVNNHFNALVNKRRKSLDFCNKGRNYCAQTHSFSTFAYQKPKPKDVQLLAYYVQENKRDHNAGKLMNKTFSSSINSNKLKVAKFEQDAKRLNQTHQCQNIPHNDHNQNVEPNYQQKNQVFEITYKQLNFIDSIKSMHLKIANKQIKDLKQLWKWLKLIAHQNQHFQSIYSLKDSIQAVCDDFIIKQKEQKQQFTFMERQCFKIIKKLNDLVQKRQF